MHVIPERVHFIGIGGAGMSGLARILLELGHHVSGSDLAGTKVTERLEKQGAVCFTGHRGENVGHVQMVVVSSAIKKDNPELLQAERKGIPVIHRAELLALLMKRQRGIAVAGAHGKTTTTSMLALVLESNSLDPTIVVGGELNDIGGNAKLGRGEYLVAEADESDGSFLKLDPTAAIITNVEDDHLDYYGTVEKIKEAFRGFINKIPSDGMAVLCLDDPGVREVAADFKGPRMFYGVHRQEADYTLRNIYLNGAVSRAEVYFRGEFLGMLELLVPGIHNMSNALGVVAAARWAGLEFFDIAGALKKFRGAGRRFQVLGEVRGIRVVDDYAHHPSEIKATLRAARQVGMGRVISVFQPHRYTRTSLLRERFGTAFSDADVIILSDIYSAGEQPIEGVSGRIIAEAIENFENRPVTYLPTREDIVNYLVDFVRPGDLILTMGAGNIWTAGIDLVKRLQAVEGS
ncbi:UDP-N-acetylmuramate--alanine ligase [Desulfocucumis palustris]|uniref:UDP-N-acetylmuramate--L-alanine ligase n=1 Tax=Desulfocucumis palustris TaxID=1898651 RepID=A0A2L2XEM0_9FIRM|nr:UDP-N-acetylmuramate--alanine ligase [Desulfocucumis palustris]